MPIQAYVDESGGKGQSKHFVMAALVSHSEDWAAFEIEWKACLASDPPVRLFKMREAAGYTGAFRRWSKTQRDDKLLKLCQIINRYAGLATHSVIDLEAHAKTWAKVLPKPLSEPYFHPYQNTILAICFELWDRGWREPFEIIFDEQRSSGLRARTLYPAVKNVVRHREPEAFQIMPDSPAFKTDNECVQIQAADLFAWTTRRNADDPNYSEFDWLLEEMRTIRTTDYSQYYDEERMISVLKQTSEYMKESAFKEMLAEHREITKGLR